MTRNRDIERVLDRFYAEGPSEMPDRVYLGVFDRIERVPQRRLALQLTRFATMNPRLRLAAAAAIVVAVVGLSVFALSQQPSVGPPTTPSPSPSAASAADTFAPGGIPAALQGRWVGAPRVVPALPEPPFRNALIVTDVQLAFALAGQGSATQLASTGALIAADQLRLRGATTDGDCQPGNEGTYTFRLSQLDTALTLTPVSDACSSRAAALAGDWVHVGCTDDEGWCLGDLAPGTHQSVIFTPFVPESAWSYAYGRFEYTVPAGWVNSSDCPWCFTLAKQGAPENTNISIWTEVAAHAQADQCSTAPEPGVGRTADEIVTWLTTLPGLVTSAPEAVAIGGLNGKVIDLSVRPTWTKTCAYAYSAGLPLVSTFASPTDPQGFDWNIQGEGRTRIIALELGDGRALVINIEAQNQADFDALLPDAMQVVNTFVFNR